MITYLDTSSLVKLYVDEVDSLDVIDLVDKSTLVATSVVAYAEARAALARRRRERALGAAAFEGAKRMLDTDWPQYFSIDATRELCFEAGGLAERYRLRGFDSIHLASFLTIARKALPEPVRFSSYDRTLNRAAHIALRSETRRPHGSARARQERA